MMGDKDPGADVAVADARKKKKSKHRNDGDESEKKSRRKKSEPQADAALPEPAEADKKKKKKKQRQDETPEEREERRRRKREKKLAKQETGGVPGINDIPDMDDIDDDNLADDVAAVVPPEALAARADEDGGWVEPVVEVAQPPPEERRRVPPPPAPKPKPKPKPTDPLPQLQSQPLPQPIQLQQEPEPIQQQEPVQIQHQEPVQVVQHQEPVQVVHQQEPVQMHQQEPVQQQQEPNYSDEPQPWEQQQASQQKALEDLQQRPKDPAALHAYLASTLEDSDDELTPVDPQEAQPPAQDAVDGDRAIEVDVRVEQPEDPEQRFSQMVEEDLTSRNAEQETPADIPEGKKPGGLLGKLFASFRRGGSKRKQISKKPAAEPATEPLPEEQPGLSEQDRWRSNPSMFNPNETHGITLDPNETQQPPELQQPSELRPETQVGDQPEPPSSPLPQPPPAAAQKPPPPPVMRPTADSEVRVILLDGEEISVPLVRKATGAELIVKVCEYVDLMETDYFGITYVDSKERMWFWLDAEKKVFKQLKHCESRLMNFQVKFYPPEPNLLAADVTRYQLCLQVRQDIYTGKLPCTWVTQALLGSFQVQSELGDFDENDHGEVGSTEYLQNFEFVHNQTPELVAKIAELHRGHKGITPEVADLRYLETARRLEFYGVDLHPARDLDDVDITLGVCYGGVLVYKDRMRISRFAWPKILRISYRKNLFYLKIRSDMYENVEAVIGFKLMNHRWAKRLWKIAVENHSFFRLKEAQMQKTGSRASLSFIRGNSAHRYSGRTMHQYRTQGGTMRQSGTFDRSLSKRMSASLPSLKGSQYGSFHSLNRAHPRDMRPVTGKPRADNPRSGSVSVLPTSAFNRRPSRTPSQASDDLL